MTINGNLTNEDIVARLEKLEPRLTRERISARAVRELAQLVRANGGCGPLGVLEDILTSPRYDLKQPDGEINNRILNARLQALNSMVALRIPGLPAEELGKKYKAYFGPYGLIYHVTLRNFELSDS